MNSSTSNAEQAVSFDFLVKVTGDKLELQHDLLRSLLVPYKDNEVPVAVVTVIGQPKSRKTLLTNYIQNCIIRLVDTKSKRFGSAVTATSGFPRSLDDCPSKSVRDKLNGQEGVLIWTKPCLVQQKDGHSLAVFILDIWSENPSPSLYTRLVDFCITSSSMVILVEDCCVSKESNWNQWDISKSCLAHLDGREFHLHVLIHADWEEENFHTLGFEGGKLFMNASKDQFSKRLSRVIDSGHILRGYFKDASYFLAQLKSESTVQKGEIHSSDSYHFKGLLEFSWKVVGFDPSKLFPLDRNKTVLSTLSVESLFWNGIVISNSVAAVTEVMDATTFRPNNIEVEMEVCEDTQDSAEVPTPSQIESKKSSQYSPTNFGAYFEPRKAAMENQSSSTFFYNLEEQVKYNAKRKFDEEVAKLELQIMKDPSNLSFDPRKATLKNYVKTLTRSVSDSKWRNFFISWYSKEVDDFTKDVHAMISAIQLYREKWKSFFIENVCVKENELHKAHSIFDKLAAGENSHEWKNNRLKVLSWIGIELTRQSFNQLNLDIINKEEVMAKQASVYAEEYYNVLMKSKISERTFTDSEIKTLHQMNVKAVVDLFHAVPQFKYTYVREQYLNELQNRLHMHLSSYLKENQQNVERVERIKKDLMRDCTKLYNDNMNKLVADRVILDEVLLSHHRQSFKEAFRNLNIRMKSSTEKFDKSSWEKELAEKLRIYFNAFAKENNRKIQHEAKSHQPAAAASIDYANARSTQSYGVGIYFGPDIVRLGIYLNAQTIPKYLKFSPFVTFEGHEIIFFNRHSSHHLHFDVYKTLVQEENFPRTVLISGKAYQLHTEEIVAVFLNKIKSEAETKFGFAITSCTVAVSAFMSTSSKQMLKTALTLAGFEGSTIIHSTTAVGLSFVVTSKVCPNGPAIFVHQAGSVFDVAIAVINQRSISMRYISGLPYLEKSSGQLSAFLDTTDSQDALSKKVKKLISSTVASSEFTAWQLEALVVVHGGKHFISDKSAIAEPLFGRPLTTLDETEGIVLGAAAFNAFQNKIPGAPNLEYNEVFPYTFIAEINGKQTAKIVRHNVPVISKNMSTQLPVTDVRDFGEVRITEFAVENQKVIVGEYTINAMNSKCENFLLCVKFNSD